MNNIPKAPGIGGDTCFHISILFSLASGRINRVLKNIVLQLSYMFLRTNILISCSYEALTTFGCPLQGFTETSTRELILCGRLREIRRSQHLSLIEDSKQDKEKMFQDILAIDSFPYCTPTLCHPSSQGAHSSGMERGWVWSGPWKHVTCRSSKGTEMESRNKMRPGKKSFFQILHRHSQGRGYQNRDRYVLKHRAVKCYLGCPHWDRSSLQRICSCEVWGCTGGWWGQGGRPGLIHLPGSLDFIL